MSEITVDATRYTVRGLPAGHLDGDIWSLSVEWTGQPWNAPPTDKVWAVRRGSQCLGDQNEWDWEPSPSERTREFYASHRFTLDDAIERAKAAYPNLVINGLRVENGELVRAIPAEGPTSTGEAR